MANLGEMVLWAVGIWLAYKACETIGYIRDEIQAARWRKRNGL